MAAFDLGGGLQSESAHPVVCVCMAVTMALLLPWQVG